MKKKVWCQIILPMFVKKEIITNVKFRPQLTNIEVSKHYCKYKIMHLSKIDEKSKKMLFGES